LISGISEINQIKFDQIEKCAHILNLEFDYDKLFEEFVNLQSVYKEVSSYRESLFVQIKKYVDAAEHTYREPDLEEELTHKISTQKDRNDHDRIRPDQLWAYLFSKSRTKCEEMMKLISFIYSIPCSNAYAEGVFSHMKHAWTCSRNSMSTETIAAELKIRLNCRMKCNEFFKFVQTEPDLIKYARRTEKYSFTKKCCST